MDCMFHANYFSTVTKTNISIYGDTLGQLPRNCDTVGIILGTLDTGSSGAVSSINIEDLNSSLILENNLYRYYIIYWNSFFYFIYHT